MPKTESGGHSPGGGASPSRLNFRLGLWRLADPTISLASIAGMFLGACIAAAAGPIDWFWLGLTVIGILAIEVGKNASGELTDFDSGTDLAVAAEDRSPFSGGKRVLVDGLLTRGQTQSIAAVTFALGIGIGLGIVVARESAVLWLGIAGVALAYFYHGAPLRFAYRGLGELAVAVAYGPLVLCGTYLVQLHQVSGAVAWLSIPLGILIAMFLWINEFPDYLADRQAGKHTLVVRLGRRRASATFALLGIAAFTVLAAAIALSAVPFAAGCGAVALLPVGYAARTLRRNPESPSKIIPAQAATLAGFVLYALAAGLGIVLGGSASLPTP